MKVRLGEPFAIDLQTVDANGYEEKEVIRHR